MPASAGVGQPLQAGVGGVVGDRLDVELDVLRPFELAQGLEPAPLLEVADQHDPARHPAGLARWRRRRPRSPPRRRSAPGRGRSRSTSAPGRRAAPGRPPGAAPGRARPTRGSPGRAAWSGRRRRRRARRSARNRRRPGAACALAFVQRSPRRRLALVSTRTAVRRWRVLAEVPAAPPRGGTAGRTRTPAGRAPRRGAGAGGCCRAGCGASAAAATG